MHAVSAIELGARVPCDVRRDAADARLARRQVQVDPTVANTNDVHVRLPSPGR